MTLDAVVHFDEDFDNAFWDGEQMVFGDGSGELFTRLTQSLSRVRARARPRGDPVRRPARLPGRSRAR